MGQGNPSGPAFGFLGCPALDIDVEGPDCRQNCVRAQTRLPVAADLQDGPPALIIFRREGEIRLRGVDLPDPGPELSAQVRCDIPQSRIVNVMAAARQVSHEQCVNVRVGDVVPSTSSAGVIAGARFAPRNVAGTCAGK